MSTTFLGSLIVVFSGILLGSFSLPMKKTTKWSWEAVWLIWSLCALVIVPWLIAMKTVPNLFGVFANASAMELVMIFVFGLVWGLGSVLFGRSLFLIGIALAFSLNLGVSIILGTLIPMLKDPSVFSKSSGIGSLIGCAIMVTGLALCAVAGTKKEKQLTSGESGGGEKSGKMMLGLLMATFAGIFSAFINFAFNFSDSLKAAAIEAGASAVSAADPAWALALWGGLIPNVLYCVFLFNKNKTWGDYKKTGTSHYYLLAALMGVVWMASVALYGRGATRMGALGGSAGFGMWMGATVLMSNFWGALTGEWKGVKGTPIKFMAAGAALMLAAIGFIGYSASL